MGEIIKFCFRPSSSFSIAMTELWCTRLFSAFVIVFYSDDSQTKTKKIFDKFFFIFSAGRVWYTITPPMDEIEKFCFLSLTKFFSFFLLGVFGTP